MMKTRALIPMASASCVLALASCSAVGKIGESSANLAASTGTRLSKITEMASHRIRPAGVPVVEVREKDLKELPTGHEQALAFENTRKRNFWSSFSGPVDFQEPTLPEASGEMDGSLLPPREQ
jgi:hypothetical protein